MQNPGVDRPNASQLRLISTAALLAASGIACQGAHPDPTQGVPKAAPEITWAMAAPCPLARFEANGVVVGDELWVLGGFVSSTFDVTGRVDIYNPAADTWRVGPPLPGAQTHVAAVTVDGTDVVVAGGFDGPFTANRAPVTAAVWRWTDSVGQWAAGPPLPVTGAAYAWALLGSELHLAGGLGPDGNTDTDAHHVWDLAGEPIWNSATALPIARNHGGGAAVGGSFYAIAGRHDWNEDAGDVPNVDAFDTTTGAWTARAPIPGARSEIAAATTTLSDGRILVVGGSLPGITPSANVLVYDPATDSWATLTPLPQPRKGTVARQVGSRIIVTTGSPTSVDPSNTTFVGCCLGSGG